MKILNQQKAIFYQGQKVDFINWDSAYFNEVEIWIDGTVKTVDYSTLTN